MQTCNHRYPFTSYGRGARGRARGFFTSGSACGPALVRPRSCFRHRNQVNGGPEVPVSPQAAKRHSRAVSETRSVCGCMLDVRIYLSKEDLSHDI